MRSRASCLILLAMIPLAGCSKKSEPLPQEPESSGLIGEFKRPLGYDDRGFVTGHIFGKSAKPLPNGTVEIYDMKLIFYKYEGDQRLEEMTAVSPFCAYDVARQDASSDAEIQISRGTDFVVTGKGFKFSNQDRRLEIQGNVRVVAVAAKKTLESLEVKSE